MMTLVGADLIACHLHLIGLRFLVFQIGGSLRLTVGCCYRLMLLVLVFMLLLESCLVSGPLLLLCLLLLQLYLHLLLTSV